MHGVLDEWDINSTLHVLFHFNPELMLIFQDSDLHKYLDKIEVPLLRATTKKPRANRRATGAIMDPQAFRPDGVALDRTGQAYIVESKLREYPRNESQALELAIQALVYAALLRKPGWGLNTGNTFEVLDLLFKAHWNLKIIEGKYKGIREAHRRHFGFSKALAEASFQNIPKILFLLEQTDLSHLRAVVTRLREMEYDAVVGWVRRSLPETSKFHRRIRVLKPVWSDLRDTEISVAQIMPQALTQVLATSRSSL